MNLYCTGWRLWDLAWLPSMHLQESEQILTFSVAGVLDEPYSQLTPGPAQRSSRTGPAVYIGWNRVHHMWPVGSSKTPTTGLANYQHELSTFI
jgi:hypothetical protein